MRGILTFLYTGKLKITPENITSFLEVAHKFQLRDLITHCVNEFQSKVRNTNVIELLLIASEHNNKKLLRLCTETIAQNFEELSKYKDKDKIQLDELLNSEHSNLIIEIMQKMSEYVSPLKKRKNFDRFKEKDKKAKKAKIIM